MPTKPNYTVAVDTKTIGKRLGGIRRARGLTQVELAGALGMTQTLLSDYERGKLRLHGGLLASFAKTLRVSTDEILGLKDVRHNGAGHDRRFMRRLERIEKLSKRDKQALLRNIDNFLKGAGIS